MLYKAIFPDIIEAVTKKIMQLTSRCGKHVIVKRITSQDIARICGVSRSTVSRVINNYPNVPEATRQRVMEVIKSHNYFPHLSGQLLTGMSTKTIGLFWLSPSAIARDSLASRLFLHIIDAAAAHDYLVLSCVVDPLSQQGWQKRIRKMFMEGRIDGGIVIGAGTNEPLVDELVDQGMFVGLFDYYKEGDPQPNRITANFHKDSGEQAIEHLFQKGHRHIAIIDGDMSRLSSVHRHEGYMRGMMRHGLHLKNEWLTYGGITKDSGYHAARRLLENCQGHYPTAICANNDSVAFGVYQACAELGLRIPFDISVIGQDGHEQGAYTQPPLTTIAFDFEKMFSSLISRLISTIEGQPAQIQDEFFEGTLLDRGSVANRSLQD